MLSPNTPKKWRIWTNDIYEKLWADAQAYNEKLFQSHHPLSLTEDEWPEYEAQLNVSGNGIIGYIEIAKINCSLPIYHGTDESALQIAIGHIEGSSLPTGGESTHCVLSGHRGCQAQGCLLIWIK